MCFLVRQKFVKSQKSFSVKKLWRIRSKTKPSFLSFFHFLWIFEGAIWPKVNSVKKVQKCETVALELVFSQKWSFLRGSFLPWYAVLEISFWKTLTLTTHIFLQSIKVLKNFTLINYLLQKIPIKIFYLWRPYTEASEVQRD